MMQILKWLIFMKRYEKNEEKDILPQRNTVYHGGKTRSFCFVLLCETQCNSVVNKK